LKFFLEQGLLATINTDDPGISAIDLHYEYDVAAPKAGITHVQCEQAQRNSLTAAFLGEEEKIGLQKKKTD
jgi:adenosine deaminase